MQRNGEYVMRTQLVVLLALVAGCKGEKEAEGLRAVGSAGSAAAPMAQPSEGTPARRGSLKRLPFAAYGVIVAPGVDTSKLEAIAKQPGNVRVAITTPADIGWSVEHAEYYGPHYDNADVATIARATFALVISAEGQGAAQRAGQAAIAVASAGHGWIFDRHEYQLYTPESLRDHLPPNTGIDVRKAIVVHQVAGEGELDFLDTAGMDKLGLPELYLAGVPKARIGSITGILNATAQTLVERGDVTRDGVLDVDASKLNGDWDLDEQNKQHGTGKITWQVTWSRGDAAPDETLDPNDFMLQLAIAGEKPGSAEKLVAASEAYLGTTKQEVRHFDYDDELRAAGVTARAELAKIRPKLAKGMPPNEQLGVKAPFTTDSGGIEWMWIDVISIKGESIDGILDSDPEQVKSLELGQRLKVKFSDIADFIYRHADGKKTGGYSLEVMRRHGEDLPPL